jgi:hypothetical protein
MLELQPTLEDVFHADTTSVEDYLQQIQDMTILTAIQVRAMWCGKLQCVWSDVDVFSCSAAVCCSCTRCRTRHLHCYTGEYIMLFGHQYPHSSCVMHVLLRNMFGGIAAADKLA